MKIIHLKLKLNLFVAPDSTGAASHFIWDTLYITAYENSKRHAEYSRTQTSVLTSSAV